MLTLIKKMDLVETITDGCEWNDLRELFRQWGTQYFEVKATLRLDIRATLTRFMLNK